MRRNWDLVRDILLKVGEIGTTYPIDHFFDIGGPLLAAHVHMMREGGLVTLSGLDQTVHLTWAGHDFLDAIRHPEVWARCREAIERNADGLPSDVLIAGAQANISTLMAG